MAEPHEEQHVPTNAAPVDPAVVLTFGTTGAGKSFLLNTVVGAAVLPVSPDLNSCTAYPIVLTHRNGSTYTLVFNMLLPQEWEERLQSYTKILSISRSNDSEKDDEEKNNAANDETKNIGQRAMYCSKVLGQLFGEGGTPDGRHDDVIARGSETIEGLTASEVHDLLESASPQSLRRPRLHPAWVMYEALWPMIRSAVVAGPFPNIPDGVRVVDMPGTDDVYMPDNGAVAELRASCTGVWFAIPASRNVGKTGELSRWLNELYVDGDLKQTQFIMTQADHDEKYTNDREGVSRQLRELLCSEEKLRMNKKYCEMCEHFEPTITSAKAFVHPQRFLWQFQDEESTGIPVLRRLLLKIAEAVHQRQAANVRAAQDRDRADAARASDFGGAKQRVLQCADEFFVQLGAAEDTIRPGFGKAAIDVVSRLRYNTLQCVLAGNGYFYPINIVDTLSADILLQLQAKWVDMWESITAELGTLVDSLVSHGLSQEEASNLRSILGSACRAGRTNLYTLVVSVIREECCARDMFKSECGRGCLARMIYNFSKGLVCDNNGQPILHAVLEAIRRRVQVALENICEAFPPVGVAAAPAPAEREAGEDSRLCPLCLNRHANSFIVWCRCRHPQTGGSPPICRTCAIQMQYCPWCRNSTAGLQIRHLH